MFFDDFKLIITCEHASCALPEGVSGLSVPDEILQSHRGYDIGAFEVYEELCRKLKPDYCSAGKFSRLYVDLNRSLKSKSAFSEFWRDVFDAGPVPCEQAKNYHQQYRQPIFDFVGETLKSSSVLHLAIHSFTPVLNGCIRNADVGILYDPASVVERKIADVIVDEIRRRTPHLKVRRNYPYLGKTDGLCTALRKKFIFSKTAGENPQKLSENFYAGFEIELNQKLLLKE